MNNNIQSFKFIENSSRLVINSDFSKRESGKIGVKYYTGLIGLFLMIIGVARTYKDINSHKIVFISLKSYKNWKIHYKNKIKNKTVNKKIIINVQPPEHPIRQAFSNRSTCCAQSGNTNRLNNTLLTSSVNDPLNELSTPTFCDDPRSEGPSAEDSLEEVNTALNNIALLLSNNCSDKMANIWKNILQIVPPDLINTSWIIDNKFTIELNKPIYIRIHPKNAEGDPYPKEGIVIALGENNCQVSFDISKSNQSIDHIQGFIARFRSPIPFIGDITVNVSKIQIDNTEEVSLVAEKNLFIKVIKYTKKDSFENLISMLTEAHWIDD